MEDYISNQPERSSENSASLIGKVRQVRLKETGNTLLSDSLKILVFCLLFSQC